MSGQLCRGRIIRAANEPLHWRSFRNPGEGPYMGIVRLLTNPSNQEKALVGAFLVIVKTSPMFHLQLL